MARTGARGWISVLFLGACLLGLTGCPKKTTPDGGAGAGLGQGATGGGAGTGAGGAQAGGAAGSAVAGSGASGSGSPSTAGAAGASGAGSAGTGAAGAGGAAAGGQGTTIPALPAPREFSEVAALADVHFDFDRAVIRMEDAEVLRRNATWLKSTPASLVLIEGHADERGTNEYNLALAERRAKAVRDFLATLGIEATRISLVSYGKERPVCVEATESCWARNRRAHFLVK